MAATIKYAGSFKDHYGKNCIVSIITDGYAGTVLPLTFAANPVEITYQGDDDDPFQTMIKSKAVINLSMENSDADLYEDMASMDENTFGVLIVVREPVFPFGLIYKWEGWLVPDDQSKTFSYNNQDITLRAIDPVSRLQGQQLLESDGSTIIGGHTLKYYIDRCFTDVFTPGNSLATYNLVIDSDIVISNTTTTVLPGVMEQLGTYASVFNNDIGQPVSGYDVVEMIARSLNMRVFYENGNIYFVDIIKYSTISSTPSITINNAFYKGFFDVTEETNTILVEPQETITRVQTFRDSICKFPYKNSVGIIKDGNLQNWTPDGSGEFLTEWFYNPYLTARTDVLDRKYGTGNAFDPYGILLTFTTNEVTPDHYTDNHPDMICGVIDRKVYTSQEISLSVSFKLTRPQDVAWANTASGWKKVATMPVWMFIYNEVDPAKSYYLSNDDYGNYVWTSLDLTGTSYASGVPDWSVIIPIYDALNNTTTLTPSSLLKFYGNAVGQAVEVVSSTQSLSFDTPPVPINVVGPLYVMLHPAISPIAFVSPGGSDTVIYSAILTLKYTFNPFTDYKGELAYVTRKIRTSKEKIEEEIALNTTVNTSVSGSVYNAITYVEGLSTIPAGTNLIKIALKDYTGVLYTGVSLTEYNAIARMYLNYGQNKIDFSTLSKTNKFYDAMSFSCFYDAGRPSTEIFQSVFIQTKSTYDLKKSQRSITAISMKSNIRDIWDNEPDDTHDFSKVYYLS